MQDQDIQASDLSQGIKLGEHTTAWRQRILYPTETITLMGEKPVKGLQAHKFPLGQPIQATNILRHVQHSSFGDVWDFFYKDLQFSHVHISLFATADPSGSAHQQRTK